MRPRVLIGAVIAAAITFVVFGFGMQMGAHLIYGAGSWEPGMMGPNVAGGYGSGMPPWMMAPYRSNQVANLSVDNVKNYFERSLAWQRNPRGKLGTVSEIDADTITADIVTTDKDGLVQRFAVNRHTGFIRPSED